MWPLVFGSLLAIGQTPDPAPPALLIEPVHVGKQESVCPVCQESRDCFLRRLVQAYRAYCPKDENNGDNGKPDCANGAQSEEPEKPRRALPAPFNSPPFPTGEYQGYPLVGVPPDDTRYPLMKALYAGSHGEAIKDSRVNVYGWLNASGNYSTSKNSNMPDSYWIVP